MQFLFENRLIWGYSTKPFNWSTKSSIERAADYNGTIAIVRLIYTDPHRM